MDGILRLCIHRAPCKKTVDLLDFSLSKRCTSFDDASKYLFLYFLLKCKYGCNILCLSSKAHRIAQNDVLGFPRNDVMFATYVPAGTHHSCKRHHWAKPTSLAKGKHHSKKISQVFRLGNFFGKLHRFRYPFFA